MAILTFFTPTKTWTKNSGSLLIKLRVVPVVLLGFLCPLTGHAVSQPLVDYDFNGYIQGQGIIFLDQYEKTDGPLNSVSNPDLAGGESETGAKIKRLEFNLSTNVINNEWSLKTTASVGGSKVTVKSGYIEWSPSNNLSWQTGLIKNPFGLENQLSASALATVESALIYDFGNFGWVDTLGLNIVDKYVLGSKLNLTGPLIPSRLTYLLYAALVSANGRQVSSSWPNHASMRTGLSAHLSGHCQLTGCLSGSYGITDTKQDSYFYMPIGSLGNYTDYPQTAVQVDQLPANVKNKVIGADLSIRYDFINLTGEWATRSIHHYFVQGYYLQTQFMLPKLMSARFEIVAKWEEGRSGLADGSHLPDTGYQLLTLGLTTYLLDNWKMQVNYITLFKDLRPGLFRGSKLFLTQLQWLF